MNSLLIPNVESTYLKTDKCKFESSQKMRAESVDSSKACSKPTVKLFIVYSFELTSWRV